VEEGERMKILPLAIDARRLTREEKRFWLDATIVCVDKKSTWFGYNNRVVSMTKWKKVKTVPTSE